MSMPKHDLSSRYFQRKFRNVELRRAANLGGYGRYCWAIKGQRCRGVGNIVGDLAEEAVALLKPQAEDMDEAVEPLVAPGPGGRVLLGGSCGVTVS